MHRKLKDYVGTMNKKYISLIVMIPHNTYYICYINHKHKMEIKLLR